MDIRVNTLFVGILSFILISQIGLFGTNQIANGQSEIGIPSWIKTNAGWWANGDIDDNSFVQGIQYLIKEDIMQIPPTTQGSDGSTNEIPSWIKTNAGWWANGDIDDNSFVQGIQFLIKEGIMKVQNPAPSPDLDRDGIPDDVDECKTQVETVNGFEDEDGCPDTIQVPDSDGDEIPDDVDECPNQSETVNGFEDEDGCPDEITTFNETSLPDKSLTISNVDLDWRNSGWGDENIFLYWTYYVEHVDNGGVGFPTQGHFVIKITGFGTAINAEAEYDEDNKFSGKYVEGFEAGIDGGPIAFTVISFIDDDRGNYIGDGDQKEIIIPADRP